MIASLTTVGSSFSTLQIPRFDGRGSNITIKQLKQCT
ncbi:hypothetical protein VPHF99_0290 [Vibrio phage F99]